MGPSLWVAFLLVHGGPFPFLLEVTYYCHCYSNYQQFQIFHFYGTNARVNFLSLLSSPLSTSLPSFIFCNVLGYVELCQTLLCFFLQPQTFTLGDLHQAGLWIFILNGYQQLSAGRDVGRGGGAPVSLLENPLLIDHHTALPGAPSCLCSGWQ